MTLIEEMEADLDVLLQTYSALTMAYGRRISDQELRAARQVYLDARATFVEKWAGEADEKTG